MEKDEGKLRGFDEHPKLDWITIHLMLLFYSFFLKSRLVKTKKFRLFQRFGES